MEPKLSQDWSKGANNIAAADRLPEGFARDIVNADPLPGGSLGLRIGYERVYSGADVRGVLAFGERLLIADGATLVEFDTVTNSSRVLRNIAGAGAFCGDVFNGQLYFSTENECLRYDGTQVKPWGVPDVLQQPPLSTSAGGSLQAGYYQVAMTYTDADGLEGGTDAPLIILVGEGGKLTVQVPTPPDGCVANIYVSSVNGSTLFWQGRFRAATPLTLTALRDDTERCATILLRAPSPGQRLVKHNGVLAIARDQILQLTEPLRPHLVNRVAGFFQYPQSIDVLLSIGQTLVVCADRCWALLQVETSQASQVELLPFPALPDSGVMLPGDPAQPLRGAWMTRYGQAISDGQTVQLVNRQAFAPAKAEQGAAGVIEHNGNQLVVTTLKGAGRGNGLAASDFFFGSVLQP